MAKIDYQQSTKEGSPFWFVFPYKVIRKPQLLRIVGYCHFLERGLYIIIIIISRGREQFEMRLDSLVVDHPYLNDFGNENQSSKGMARERSFYICIYMFIYLS